MVYLYPPRAEMGTEASVERQLNTTGCCDASLAFSGCTVAGKSMKRSRAAALTN